MMRTRISHCSFEGKKPCITAFSSVAAIFVVSPNYGVLNGGVETIMSSVDVVSPIAAGRVVYRA